MLNRAIIFLILGVVLPYIGMWFAGNFLLGRGEQPNFVPMQVASSFALLLSIGLYFLSRVEKNPKIRTICVFVAVAYFISGLGVLTTFPGNDMTYSLLNLNLFFKVAIAFLVGILVLRNCVVAHEKI